MKFLEDCRSFLLYLAAFLESTPSFREFDNLHSLPVAFSDYSSSNNLQNIEDGPKFRAPNGFDSVNKNFTCHYPSLGKEWKDCTTPGNRKCWLRNRDGHEYNITTNYETEVPPGITRKYYLELSNMIINGDGVINPDGKVFNQSYPGPWIQACWGDTLEITVKNNLKFNGTTIHWHGLRQLETMEMDGVNGVTQCPIAPNDTFTYTFKAMQYGTSWYHSHYSLQYADGVLGPLTIYGPSSAEYDEAKDPIMISDWNHRSAFKDWSRELTNKPSFPKMNSVLINGIGNFAGQFSREVFNITVTKGKKYLLRIINTSVDTTYVFSIDNHEFQVMTTDFVPIHPYTVNHVVVGIGQRYHVVLHANPIAYNGAIGEDGNYWIRTIPTDGCAGFETGNKPDERQGILRYNATSKAAPITFRENFETKCRDEHYKDLVPINKWIIPPVPLSNETRFDIGKDNNSVTAGRPVAPDRFSWWSFGKDPLWLDFGNPTILNLHNESWNRNYVVIEKNYPKDAWVYLVITAPVKAKLNEADRSFFAVAHPIHLHGHDFAIISQGTNSTEIDNAVLKFINPPRRDVALLPSGGYLVIAFKADNPGSWLLHCHIAWHASSGLALQILERQDDLNKIMTPDKLKEPERVCSQWHNWFKNASNHWHEPGHPIGPFQDDSGI